MPSLGDMVVSMRADVSQLVKSMKTTEDRIGRVAKASDKAGSRVAAFGKTVMASGAFLAIGKAVKGSIGSMIEFDDQMRMVAQRSGATADELSLLSTKAQDLGRHSSFTALEVSAMMTSLGTSNFSPKEIDTITESVMHLSRATGTDAANSAIYLGSTLRVFNMDATEASKVTDILTFAANNSLNTLDDIGASMKYTGTVAQAMGVSLSEATAATAMLGNMNIRGEQAGTTMRRILTLTGSDAERMADIFGKSFTDIDGNFVGLTEAFEIMESGTAHLTDIDKMKKFSDAFGILGVTGGLVLSETGASVRKMADEMDALQGYAKKGSEALDKGPGGSLRLLMSAVKGFAIMFGYKLSESFSGAADSLTTWINWATDNFYRLTDHFAQGWLIITESLMWAVNNWSTLLEYWYKDALLDIVGFGETMKHLFTKILPAYVRWFGEQFGNIIVTAGNNVLTTFENLGKNIKSIWDNVMAFITGGDYDFENMWKPLTEGYINTIDAMPLVPDRVITGLEASLKTDLDKLGSSLGSTFQQAVLEPLGTLKGMQNDPGRKLKYEDTPPGQEKKSPGGPNKRSDYTTKAPDTASGKWGASIMQKGSSEAYKGILSMMGQDRKDKLARKQIALLAQVAANTAAAVAPGLVVVGVTTP